MNAPRDLQPFMAACADTAAWCELEGKLSAFRTEILRPVLEDPPTASAFEAALDMVRRRRRELLRGRTASRLPEGRLLICQVNESIWSGESEHETSGFFDVHDRPPWDTSIWQLRSSAMEVVTLVSWVPLELEATVSRGIDVNPYDCIYWLTDTPPGSPVRSKPRLFRLLECGSENRVYTMWLRLQRGRSGYATGASVDGADSVRTELVIPREEMWLTP